MNKTIVYIQSTVCPPQCLVFVFINKCIHEGMCIVESYSVLCQVGGLVDTGTGHSITAPGWTLAGAGEAQRSHCQNLSTSKYNLAEAVGCWDCWEMSRRLGPGTRS